FRSSMAISTGRNRTSAIADNGTSATMNGSNGRVGGYIAKNLLVRIGLRPRRSALGVVPELAEFLRAAAGFGDLRGPLDGGSARREFQDTEAAVELLGLRVGLVRDGAVGGDHQRRDVLVDTTTEHIDAGILRLAYDRVCRFADGSHVFVGDVHRRSGEGDKVLRHRSVLRV